MAAYVEQRAYKRYDYQVPIAYEYYQSNNLVDAKMLNHSMGGMCFKSNHAIPKGVEIYIKMINYSPIASAPECREGYRAEVRWCRKASREGMSHYEVGVNYYEPVLF